MTSSREMALDLAANYGIPVFPCKADKSPATPRGFYDATTDLDQIESWFANGALIGVPTGEPSGIVCLDVDPDGTDWYQQHADSLACGCVNRTRRGYHLLYKRTAHVPCSTSKVAKGIDVRGDGGYIVYWPGEGLQQVGSLDDLTPFPDWVLKSLAPKAKEVPDATVLPGMGAIEGSRNDYLSRQAYKMRKSGLTLPEILAALRVTNQQRCNPPLDDAEVVQIVQRKLSIEAEPQPEPLPVAQPETKDRRIKWRELEGKTPPERVWLIKDWLTYGITHLAGRGGIGKSLVSQTIGTALALGRNYIDRIAEPKTVLIWACEDDHDELWRRQLAINAFFGCTMADLEGRLIIQARLGADNSMVAQAFGSLTAGPAIKEWHEQIADYRADVAMLDNIAHSFGGNENDRHHVTSFINALAPHTERPLATLLLGHTARSIGSEFAGSAAWENAARMRWLLDVKLPDQKPDEDAVPEDGVRYLAKRKANYSVNDWRKLIYADGTYRPVEPISRVGSYADQSHQEQARRCLLTGLRKLTGMAIPVTHASNSPSFLPRKMVEMKLSEDFSAADLKRAMNELLITGQIEVGVVGKYDKGGNRTGLKLVDLDPPK